MTERAHRQDARTPRRKARRFAPIGILLSILLLCLVAVPRLAPQRRSADLLQPSSSAGADRPPAAALPAAKLADAPPAREAALAPSAAPDAEPEPRKAPARAAIAAAPDPADPTGRVELLVLQPDGRPAPLASVELRAGETSERHAADAAGRVTLAAAGEVVLVAWRDAAASDPLELSLLPGETRRAELRLRPTTRVSGRIVDAETGAPVTGATVRFWTHAELDLVRTDADGVFHHPRFPAGEAAHQLRVEHPAYGPSVRYLACGADGWTLFSPRDFEEEAGGADDPWLELALAPALRVTGRVTDEALRPLSGGLVRVEGFVRLLGSVASPDAAEVEPGADGTFELSGLRADIGHALVVTAPGRARHVVELPAGTRMFDAGLLALLPERTLTGFVVDADGIPVGGLEVELVTARAAVATPASSASAAVDSLDAGARFAGHHLALTTDEHGAFEARGLGPERLHLRLLRAGYVLAEEVVDLRDEPAATRTYRLSPALATLAGVVESAAGAAAGAEVLVRWRGATIARVAADARGRFRVAGLDEAGPYELEARWQGADRLPLIARAQAWCSEQPRLVVRARELVSRH